MKIEYHVFALALLCAWPVQASSCLGDGVQEPNVFEANVIDRRAFIGDQSVPVFLTGFAAAFYEVDIEATIRVLRVVRGQAPPVLTWKGKVGVDRQRIGHDIPSLGPIVVYTSQSFTTDSVVWLTRGCDYDRGTYDDVAKRYSGRGR